jgi:di/tricarboxylate transporter
MFVLSYALQKTGIVERLGQLISKTLPTGLRPVILGVCTLAALCSAFVNNTPIVAIFMPVLLGIARERELPVSRLLIPLSFATIMGGCCTLLGTSTNILVNGIAQEYGVTPLAMFDLAWTGIPILLAGMVYLWIFSPLLIPARTTLTATLTDEMRKSFLCQILVKEDSQLVGKKLLATSLGDPSSFRILEVRRKGARLMEALNHIVIEPFDRILISASAKKMAKLAGSKEITLDAGVAADLGVENLSTIEGKIVEGIIAPRSRLLGRTLRSINFRQNYGMLILAVHRHGRNLSRDFQDVPLELGDTLLMLGPIRTFEELRDAGDFLLLTEHDPPVVKKHHPYLALLAIFSVVALATTNLMPIVAATTIACIALILTGVLRSDEAYKAIDWQIIFLIYGSLGIGLAMENTGTAAALAKILSAASKDVLPATLIPFMSLAALYLATNILTEILSNNATAAMITPIAINLAKELDASPYPYIIAVMIAASASFSTPIGYQTNTMIYGAGGYKFTDFVRVGLPLNFIVFTVSMLVIPLVWSF